MDVLEEKWPFFLRYRLNMQGAIQPFARMSSSIAKRPSVARIPQNFQHTIVGQSRPMNRSGMRAGANTVWKEQLLVPKILHGSPGRRCPFEGRKQHPKGVLHLGLGVKMNGLIFHIHQSDWQLELERCSLRLIENPSSETSTQNVEFSFAHCPFHSQEQPIIKGGWIIQTIFIQNEGSSQGTQFQQMMPIQRTARLSVRLPGP